MELIAYELLEPPVVELLEGDAAARERRFQGPPPLGSFQPGSHGGAGDRHPGGERFLDEAHPFGQGEAALFARLAPLQVTDDGQELGHR